MRKVCLCWPPIDLFFLSAALDGFLGNNHPWLVKMLREVHLLERLRHPNIVNYKHAWLEYSQLTPFGKETGYPLWGNSVLNVFELAIRS